MKTEVVWSGLIAYFCGNSTASFALGMYVHSIATYESHSVQKGILYQVYDEDALVASSRVQIFVKQGIGGDEESLFVCANLR